MSKTFIDELWEDKRNLKNIKDEDIRIDWDKAINYINEINNIDDYIPIMLRPLLTEIFFSNISEEAMDQFFKAYWIQHIAEPEIINEFLRKDLIAWLEKYPEYKEIIING